MITAACAAVNGGRLLKPLATASRQTYPQAMLDYFRYYGLHYDTVEHAFGTFRFRDRSFAGHIFVPAACDSAVLLMHGYLDHAGLLSTAIRHFLAAGYAVAVYDMPGHGLSPGEPSGIDSFATYSGIMAEFIGLVKKKLDLPLHLIGHSTGGATVMDYVLTGDGAGIGKVVLAAPLVRSYLWNASRCSYAFLGRVIRKVPRVFRKTSSDAAFVAFNRQDPLQNWNVPLGWVKALVEWNERMEKYPPSGEKVLVLQGKKDTVVDWRYNMRFISGKFPNAEVRYFEKAGHQLLNEAEDIRAAVFSAIDIYLQRS
jgi:alpha-beta hydrolase superfamily lysophospholipase